jgi:uncharacterized membrane protein YeaQ/YmgE (transglycosylase-associated protein family)
MAIVFISKSSGKLVVLLVSFLPETGLVSTLQGESSRRRPRAAKRRISAWFTIPALVTLLCRLSADHPGGSMQYIWMAIIGLIVGALAKLIMPGKDPGGIIVTILLGIAGSFIGTFIGRALGLYQPGQAAGFIMSLVGAIVLLVLYRLIFKRSAA